METASRQPRRKLRWMAGALGALGGIGLLWATISDPGPHPEHQRLEELKAQFAPPSEVPYPPWNRHSPEKYTLGKALFFDPLLSGSNRIACASCHKPDRGWSDGLPRAVGATGKPLPFRTPTLLNVAWQRQFFWDGREVELWKQALGPITSPDEMAQDLDELVEELRRHPRYPVMFRKAYPGTADPITPENTAKAIAVFERGIVAAPSRFDRWVAGDRRAMNHEELDGLLLFAGRGQCIACHTGWNFSDGSLHLIGLEGQRGRRWMKTPTLRNVEDRAPYMHDGSLATLDDVLDHYSETSQTTHPENASRNMPVQPPRFTEREKAQLKAFLHTLSSPSLHLGAPPADRSIASR